MEAARLLHPLGEKKLFDDVMLHPLQFRAIITLEPGTICYRRGGRAAEGPALEKQYPVKNGIVGSNPTLSARWVDSLTNPDEPVAAKPKSRLIGKSFF